MSGPLEGVRVLDLTRLLPGAFATALLGDLGADVIKVEQPGTGDPMRNYAPRVGDSSAFTWIADRNKRSIALNLRDPRGVEAVHRLVRDVDVVVEGFRPGVCDRLGIGFDALRAVNPALVYCSISGYGADGPLQREAGHDLNYLEGRRPVVTGAIPGIQVADIAGGSLMAVAGLLAALLRAHRTGEGDHVDISITDGAFALLSIHVGAALQRRPHPRPGHRAAQRRLALLPDLRLRGRQAADRGRAGDAVLDRGMRGRGPARPARDAVRSKRGTGVAGDLRRPRPRRVDDVVRGRRRLRRPGQRHGRGGAGPAAGPPRDGGRDRAPPARSLPQIGVPIKLREHPGGIRTPAPALGQDTRELLAGAGYDEDEIEQLLADGVAAARERMAA